MFFCVLNIAILVGVFGVLFIPLLRSIARDQESCFSALGYVGPTSARVFVRCPLATAAQVVLHDETLSEEVPLNAADDHCVTLPINGLKPNTGYRYFVRFRASDPGTDLPAWSEGLMRGSFVTQPAPNDTAYERLRFAFGSCFLKDSLRPLDRVADVARFDPAFVLFLGDFIYIDQGVYLGTSDADYARKYKFVMTDPVLAPFRTQVPWYFMYDDHELLNDWDLQEQAPFDVAMENWQRYNGALNPPSSRAGAHYFNFTYGASCFFVQDTRRYRSPNDTPDDDEAKTMLGKEQLDAFLSWLQDSNADCMFRFVATGPPFTASIVNSRDTWTFFVAERNLILDTIRSNNITGVVFLSGDRHTAAAIRILDEPLVYEVSASPMDGFWSTFLQFTDDSKGEDVLGEWHSADHYGIVEVDTSKREAELHIQSRGVRRNTILLKL